MHWCLLVLTSLGPVFRGGLINFVEGSIPKCVSPGRGARHKREIFLDVEGECVQYYAMDELVLDDASAAQLHQRSWAGVQSLLGLGCMEMYTRVALRLWLLHLSTPLMFLVVFYAVRPVLDSLQLALAVCVLVREVIYMALVFSVVCQQPAFLFFDVLANIRMGEIGLATTFILSPDLMLAGGELVATNCCVNEIILRPLLLILNTCAILALIVGSTSESFYPPLAVLYIITGLSALWTSLALVFGESEAVNGIRISLRRACGAFVKAGKRFCWCGRVLLNIAYIVFFLCLLVPSVVK